MKARSYSRNPRFLALLAGALAPLALPAGGSDDEANLLAQIPELAPARRAPLLLRGHERSLAALAETLERHAFEVGLAVPDGSTLGLSDRHSIASNLATLTDVNVTLELRGDPEGFNGDLYVSLVHESGFAVLLNRPGRRLDETGGYSDNGLSITLDDDAPRGDLHDYRLTLTGSSAMPIDPAFLLPLTGSWAPDGRAVSPLSVVSSDPRTAFLSSFNGLSGSGEWVLYAADLEPGGKFELVGWELELQGRPIPEPGLPALLGVGLFCLMFARRQAPTARRLPAP